MELIDYVNYVTRQKGGSNGNFGKVEIYTKCEGDADFVLNQTVDFGFNGGADYQLISDDGKRTTLEAIYSIKTHDGINIHVRNEGIVYSGRDSDGKETFYFKAAPRFEAPADSKYAWLNNAIYVCSPSFGQPGTITLDVWMVR